MSEMYLVNSHVYTVDGQIPSPVGMEMDEALGVANLSARQTRQTLTSGCTHIHAFHVACSNEVHFV